MLKLKFVVDVILKVGNHRYLSEYFSSDYEYFNPGEGGEARDAPPVEEKAGGRRSGAARDGRDGRVLAF